MIEKITVNRANLASQDIYMHDAKIINIECNYHNHKVTLDLDVSAVTGLNADSARLIFMGLKQLDMSQIEPWGKGIHIFSIEVSTENLLQLFDRYKGMWQKDSRKPNLDFSFQTKVLLNSGDEINIISESFNIELKQ